MYPQETKRRYISIVLKYLPLVSSAGLFLSAILIFFAPLPLVGLVLTGPVWLAVLGVITNMLIVLKVSGYKAAILFAATCGLFSFSIPLLLKRYKKPDMAILGSLVLSLALFTAIWWGTHTLKGIAPWNELRQDLHSIVEVAMSQQKIEPGTNTEEVRHYLLRDMPGSLVAVVLGVLALNVMFVLRFNVGGVRDRIGWQPGLISRWKAPEILVWPAILTGGFWVYSMYQGEPSGMDALWPWILGAVKLLMALYFFQGLCVIGYYIRSLKITGVFAIFLMIFAALGASPIVLGLGFFDQWFDFRAKVRQF